MNARDTYIHVRIDSETKEMATDALRSMGLTVSEAIRIMLLRVAKERRLPLDVREPEKS